MGDKDGTGAGAPAAKPTAPKVPKRAPQEIKDFVKCKRASVEIAPGKLEWLPLPITPTATFAPGTQPGSVEVTLETPVNTMRVSATVADGRLELDTTNLPVGADDANEWVRQLNDWIASKGKKLGPPTLKDGNLTLTKVAIAPAGAAVPGVKEKVSFDPFPNVPAWEKGVAAGALVLATTVGIAAMPDTKTEIVNRTVPAVVSPVTDDTATTTTAAPTTTSTTTEPAPLPVLSPEVVDACVRLVHGSGQSTITPIFTTFPQFDGPWAARFATGPTGGVSGTGTVVNGLGEIPITIFAFGSYDGLTLIAPDGSQVPLGPFNELLPFTVGPDEQSCDGATLTPAPAEVTGGDTGDASNSDVGSGGEATGGDAVGGETGDDGGAVDAAATDGATVPVRRTTEGRPWSLLFIPGTAVAAYGALSIEQRRRAFDETLRAIRGGVVYANVHNAVFPGGEIRGQLRFGADEPQTARSFDPEAGPPREPPTFDSAPADYDTGPDTSDAPNGPDDDQVM
ncbi:MAG: CHRD domain-containing protein [Actinomycetota bacterium]